MQRCDDDAGPNRAENQPGVHHSLHPTQHPAYWWVLIDLFILFLTVLRIRIPDPVFFYPLDPGSRIFLTMTKTLILKP
jgi:hypothetical protein